MTSTPAERKAWTAAGADTAAKNTYNSIRTALKDIEAQRNVQVFLQGSYANHTNVRADSDVDVVVMTTLTFTGSIDRLGPTSRAAWDALPTSPYTYVDLRAEVTSALNGYYGASRVHPKNKCIKVDATPGYVDADVVPCLQYRWFPSTYSNISTDFIEGVSIFPQIGSRIINFPKEHIKNGEAKNAAAYGNYKSTVRQMKRLRTRAVQTGFLADGIAPGYLLECMTYNVPNLKFSSDPSQRLQDVILWLKHADKASFKSCDGIHLLFQTDPGDFKVATAQTIIDALWAAF